MFPMLFEPNLHPVVWGGDAINPWKGLPASDEPIGESWEVSGLKSSPSIISKGPLKGKDLPSLIAEHPNEILGEAVVRRYGNEMPLLIKFIDARRDLSIQVHPNDEMAHRLHNKRGKTEMWYVIDAKPGAYLYAGFSKPLLPDNDPTKPENREAAMKEYKRLVAEGTITEVLAKHEVKAGDVFYLPAGRVHAICSGILLAEVQQSSDVTYRIFDYNRPGMDGKPRELHTDLAAEALDFKVEDNYRTVYTFHEGEANMLIDSPFFSVELVDATQLMHRDMKSKGSFVVLMGLKGNSRIRYEDGTAELVLYEGYSMLIPACKADYNIMPYNAECRSLVLEAYIDTNRQG